MSWCGAEGLLGALLCRIKPAVARHLEVDEFLRSTLRLTGSRVITWGTGSREMMTGSSGIPPASFLIQHTLLWSLLERLEALVQNEPLQEPSSAANCSSQPSVSLEHAGVNFIQIKYILQRPESHVLSPGYRANQIWAASRDDSSPPADGPAVPGVHISRLCSWFLGLALRSLVLPFSQAVGTESR
ncbi:hypothetical protein K458DRAFT_189923 [Lentithecium fluviatile CBS 122367]|uniref:Uncharacterized protein n=1 Tax=Lentithecium fluviatile CBS 122367 TaxID=1168545 RepID=A0A6G1JAE1_9PLEO|nr:hypothetical protein K458DRAFT_189923 [Lentithecium fluviatile CBS 122367]